VGLFWISLYSTSTTISGVTRTVYPSSLTASDFNRSVMAVNSWSVRPLKVLPTSAHPSLSRTAR